MIVIDLIAEEPCCEIFSTAVPLLVLLLKLLQGGLVVRPAGPCLVEWSRMLWL